MTKLKKVLGFTDIMLATIGYIVGAGIYAIIGITSKYSKDFTWMSILICGLLAICTGLSYAELASIFDVNGGEYFYIKEAFNDNMAKGMGGMVMLTEMLALNSIAFGMGDYLSTLMPSLWRGSFIISAILLIGFAYLNYSGIRASVNYNNISTLIEVCGLILISILGFKYIKKDAFNISTLNFQKFNL